MSDFRRLLISVLFLFIPVLAQAEIAAVEHSTPLAELSENQGFVISRLTTRGLSGSNIQSVTFQSESGDRLTIAATGELETLAAAAGTYRLVDMQIKTHRGLISLPIESRHLGDELRVVKGSVNYIGDWAARYKQTVLFAGGTLQQRTPGVALRFPIEQVKAHIEANPWMKNYLLVTSHPNGRSLAAYWEESGQQFAAR